MKSKHLRWIGNTLIASSITSLLIVFSPIISDFFKYQFMLDTYQSPNTLEHFTIDIPAIRVSSSIAANINPWDKGEYQTVLKNDVAHALGSAVPGESGTVYLFAHSSDNPFEITRYNTDFYRLHRLENEAIIRLTYQGKEYYYQVTDKLIVDPTQVDFLNNVSQDQLILQTCTPIGTDWKRLLVIAKPITNHSSS